MSELCRHCGAPIIYEPMEGHDWWHDLGDDDPASPYLNCHPTTIAEPEQYANTPLGPLGIRLT